MTTLERQSRLLPERGNQFRAPLHRAQPTPRIAADFLNSVHTKIGDLAVLQMVPDPFHRVKLWSVGGEEFKLHIPVLCLNPLADQAAAVHVEPIPDDQQAAANLSAQRFEKLQQVRRTNGARKETKVIPPEGDAGDRRELSPMKAVLDDRGLSHRRPATHQSRPLRESRLVYEDDGLSAGSGVFFRAGQRLVRHCRIAASSRCTARFAGRWQENPSPLSKCQMWPVLYCTSKRRAMSLATRGSVHSSVGKPLAMAPCTSACVSSRLSRSSNCAGRPKRLRLSASLPLASNSAAQRETDSRLTSNRRATSACDTSCLSSLTAWSRRCSSALKSRLCFMRSPDSDPARNNARQHQSVVIHLYDSQ